MPINYFVSLDKLSHFLSKLKEKFVQDPNYVHTDNNFTTADKDKLDGIAENANNYTLPAATTTTLGGVIVGNGLKVDSTGTISAKNDGTYLPLTGGTLTGDLTLGTHKAIFNGEGAIQFNSPLAGGALASYDENGVFSIGIAESESVAADPFIFGNDSTNGIVRRKDLPTKLSQFTNDEGFVTNTVDNLTNYYLKTETYSQEEVNAKIAAIKTIDIEVVDTLPTTGQSNVIYLVPNTGSGTNSYDEYVWVASQNKFEKIGSTDIDLTQYWAKTELTECTNEQIDALFTT